MAAILDFWRNYQRYKPFPAGIGFSIKNKKIRKLQKERKEFYKLLDSKNKKIGIKSFLLKKTPIWD